MGLRKIWDNWDDSQKATAVKITGLAVAVLAFAALLSSLSYLFTWKPDQSLLSDPDMMSLESEVHNGAGKVGHGFGYLLICRLFGLGSFALLVILFAVAARLLLQRWQTSLLKTAVFALSGAFVSSLLFSFIGGLVGLGNAFGGGLGGECGSFLVSWSENLIGPVLTAVLILVLLFLWLFFFSPAFKERVNGFVITRPSGEEKEGRPSEAMEACETQAQTGTVEPAPAALPTPMPAAASGTSPSEEACAVMAKTPDAQAKGSGVTPDGQAPVTVEKMGNDLSTKVDEPLPRIDIREELPGFKFPPLDILENHSFGKTEVSREELTRNRNKISTVLETYRIQVANVTAVVGPTVTLYKVYPAPGVRISAIKQLQDDIAMNLNARGVRITTLSDSVGIEVANDKSATVPLKALLNDASFRNSEAELPVAIGYTITQKVKVFDLADTPHLLVAGATKQGKSVGLNVIVSSLLYAKHPSELKLVFIDPKMVEFSSYAKLIKHYLAVLPTASDEEDEMQNAIVKKAQDAEKILRSLCLEMDERYELLSTAMVNNVKLYNEKYKDRHLLPTKGHRYLPYLVVVVDEYADLTMSIGGSAETRAASKSIQSSIIRLAQKGRAAGIHVILATQRPSVDVISGIIKANFPTRIAFRVSQRADSQTILDTPGAEKLIGKGDMLYYSGVEMDRIQCGYVSGDEIQAITDYIGSQKGYRKSYNTPYYLPDVAAAEGEAGGLSVDMNSLDDRFEEAARLVFKSQKGSTSDIQRHLGMGYARAGKVMDQLEAAGIVGAQVGSKPREVLVQDLDDLENIIRTFVRK